MEVPDERAGLLIGEKGATVARVEAYSGCKLRVQRRGEGKFVEIAYTTPGALAKTKGAVACLTQLGVDDKRLIELRRQMERAFNGKKGVCVKTKRVDDESRGPGPTDTQASRLVGAAATPPATPEQEPARRQHVQADDAHTGKRGGDDVPAGDAGAGSSATWGS